MEALVQMNHITKRFPGVVALQDITLDIMPGEVHVLLGENGAGKSTLMKILSGVYQPDEGEVIIGGKTYAKLTPREAKENGIAIIYQELSVINELSIMENVFLGALPARKKGGIGVVNYTQMREKARTLLDSVELKRDPGETVANLNISEKQMVEIAKTLALDAKVIVMDEPTSSLSEVEAGRLFKQIRQLKKEGKGIIYISHKLDEIMAIGDRVSVLKDGQYVGTYPVKESTVDGLVTLMVGRELKNKYQGGRTAGEAGEVIFEVKNLTRKDHTVQNASFFLRKGEVLGFSGLIGAGRSELMCAIYGISPIKEGEILLNGRKLHIRNPYDALKQGIGLVSENRRETGFFGNFTIKRNISIAKQLMQTKMGGLLGMIHVKEEQEIAEKAQKEMSIKCASLEQNITELSGGNQQKVILGKWLSAGVKLVIFDEPTKGIDVGTKSEIYKLMQDLAQKGIGVIVVSSEMPELLSVCDRIIVMNRGHIKGEFSIEEATEEKLMKAAIE